MVNLKTALMDLLAADLMSRNVVMVPQKMSLHAAAHMLAQRHISGAPVIDEQGRCIGVLSATDLVNWLDRGERSAKRRDSGVECVCSDWQMVDLEAMPVDEVCRFMTTDLVTALPGTPIGDLAQRMLDAHIHRIIVTDAQGRPVGIVSSTDILAAVARCNIHRDEERHGVGAAAFSVH
ncbi:MAG TPA: CBS domain-containing protein [Gemmataceae bacterium]|jgi:CBS-domain-containing membrane protein